MIAIHDDKERQQALDPKHSFIVQAPAGSGKTELLTQRYLILLARVKQPEEILAITFTKKSAAEMRARIIKSLKNAYNDPEPVAPHAKKTWELAKAVLKQAALFNWGLLENPNRLRIQTIDSFNAYLTKQLPILSHFGATPEILNHPEKLYREAVQEFLTHLEENVTWSEAIAQLLIHMDNDLNKVETLLINMLAKRDQWLPYILFNNSNESLRATLESHLASITTDALEKLNAIFPKEKISELLLLLHFAAENLKETHPLSNIIAAGNLTHLPGTELSDKNKWQGIAEILLTKEFEWRKRIDKNIGFPAPSSSKNAEEKSRYSHYKTRLSEFIEEISTHEKLRIVFEELGRAPHPIYPENQWKTLHALHSVLQIVVAQLKLHFQQHGKIDYIENAQGALFALGTEDNPTDMTLTLDYQIKHILIDEFQDTSTSQYRLIEKLIAGWEVGDGRTLFLVGDPMQSIYRFREAEVGLFIRARSQGIGNIRCIPLTLSVNFRSDANVVHWVNDHFKKVLPPFNDIAMGAVSYSASIPFNQNTGTQGVFLHPFVDTDEQVLAQSITQLIKKKRAEESNKTIAILVRSRTHLAEIIPALKEAKIGYRAIDIDPLDTRPIIQDLMALTRALLHPADRIAWLATLRAPWCGLSLSDLLNLSFDDPHSSLFKNLQKDAVIKQLSEEGQLRVKRILPILQEKITDRYRYSLRVWVENTWLALGGPASASNATDLQDAAAYFQLLEKFNFTNELPNFADLKVEVSRLYASPNNQVDNRLQIMTIHNAKGLEFDTVILPHLERQSQSDDKQLLLWMERPQQQDKSALLLAPIHATNEDSDLIYDYIKKQQAIKNDYEIGRLLYVAATRAKTELHCFFNLKKENEKISAPASRSLLHKLWSSAEEQILKQLIYTPVSNKQIEKGQRFIRRLTHDWTNPLKELQPVNLAYHNKNSGFMLPNHNPRIIGITTHQILQQISLFGIDWWLSKSSGQINQYLETTLSQLGMIKKDLEYAMHQVLLAIENTLNDARGQWLLQSHMEAQNEFAISAMINNEIKSLVIDRTFIENDIRWIIDYKTSSPNQESLEDFLKKEKEKYLQHMQYYASAIQTIDSRPIKLGLYFPLIPTWCEL